MKKEQYERIMGYLNEHKALCKALIVIEKVLELSVVFGFVLLLSYLLYTAPLGFLRITITALVALIVCTLLRVKINSPRPYEVYGIPSVMKKETRGQSFPSRHMTSIAVISVCMFFLSTALGIAFLAATLLMGVLRVLLGVHFIKDVTAGALIGFAAGIIGVYII